MRALFSIIMLLGTVASLKAQATFVQNEINDDQYILRVKNNLPCPLVITAKSTSDTSYQQFLPKRSKRILIKLPVDSVQNFQEYQQQLRYSLMLGNPDAIPDSSYQYLLPYPRGKSYRLIKNKSGNFSQRGAASHNAFDFEMDEGSVVTAIRGGFVGFLINSTNVNSSNKELMQKGNQVFICHDDGTVAIYSHLKKGESLVSIGDPIFAGQAVGLSGHTNNSTIPQLHLTVMLGTKSIPIKFRNLPDSLIKGRSYKQNPKF